MKTLSTIVWMSCACLLASATGCALRPVVPDGASFGPLGVAGAGTLLSGTQSGSGAPLGLPGGASGAATALDGSPAAPGPGAAAVGPGEGGRADAARSVAGLPGRELAAAAPAAAAAAAPAPAAPAAPAPPVPAPADAAVDPAALVTVTLRPADPTQHYEVKAASGATCTLPCSLQLPAGGPVLLVFSGDGELSQFVNIPPAGGTMEVSLASGGASTAGSVLLGGALVLALVGGALTPVLGAIPLIACGGVALVMLATGLIVRSAAGTSSVTPVAEGAHAIRQARAPAALALRTRVPGHRTP